MCVKETQGIYLYKSFINGEPIGLTDIFIEDVAHVVR